jgi:hypothetical protein
LEQYLFKKGSANVLFAGIIVPILKNYYNQQSKAGSGLKAALRPKCRKNTRHFCLAKPLVEINRTIELIFGGKELENR